MSQSPNNPALTAALENIKNDLAKRETVTAKTDWLDAVKDFDWKNLPPPQMAIVLSQIPYTKGRGEGSYFLTPAQAIIFAMECFRLGLSPLGTEAWFNPQNWKVAVTAEGQRSIARRSGLQIGPPSFEEVKQPWPKHKTLIPGYAEDIGYKATLKVYLSGASAAGNTEQSQYTAWLSEWFRPTPVWREQTRHMLQVRAYDKALEFTTGVGISAPIENQDREVPQITVTALEPKSQVEGT